MHLSLAVIQVFRALNYVCTGCISFAWISSYAEDLRAFNMLQEFKRAVAKRILPLMFESIIKGYTLKITKLCKWETNVHFLIHWIMEISLGQMLWPLVWL